MRITSQCEITGKEDYYMTTEQKKLQDLMSEAVLDRDNKCITYKYMGYTIRVHFNGTKTFVECLKNLAERKLY